MPDWREVTNDKDFDLTEAIADIKSSLDRSILLSLSPVVLLLASAWSVPEKILVQF